MDTNEKKDLQEDVAELKVQVRTDAADLANAMENLMDSKISLAAAEKKLHDYEMEQLGKRLGL